MNVLVSACACAPGVGSELEIGWRWSLEIARLGHQVWVITRTAHRTAIEIELARLGPIPNLQFVYHDPPSWCLRLLNGRIGTRIRYRMWQNGAYAVARSLTRHIDFDRVHHVTWQAVRYPSRMGELGIPFFFGPVGGGETAPWQLRVGYGVRGWVAAILRDGYNAAARLSPWLRTMSAQADRILVTTEQTRSLIPTRHRSKAHIQLGIGCDPPTNHTAPHTTPDTLQFLFVGRFLDWKGMHLGIPAFASAQTHMPNMRLTLIGDGPAARSWRRLARQCDVGGSVTFQPWIRRDELLARYSEYDALLFPSLHDPGGMAVLEALARGLPVICLDLGGPGFVVDDTCGRAIPTGNRPRQDVIDALSIALLDIAADGAYRESLAEGARRRALEFEWAKVVGRLYRTEPRT